MAVLVTAIHVDGRVSASRTTHKRIDSWLLVGAGLEVFAASSFVNPWLDRNYAARSCSGRSARRLS